MKVAGQELLNSRVSHPSPWRSRRVVGVSETVTSRPRSSLGPERREITLEVSRRLVQRPWFGETLSSILSLLALGDNWNGYGERAIHESAVKRAVNVLAVIGAAGPCPDVVPTSEGGIQLEWAGAGFEIEVEVPPVGPASIFLADPSGEYSEVLAGRQHKIWERLREHISAIGAASA